jgi:hypothetical protein
MPIANGTDIILMISGERVAALTSNDESYTTSLRETTSKDSRGDANFLAGKREGELNCAGLFFEQSVNLLQKSEDLTASIWEKTSFTTVTANYSISPYNTKVSDLVSFNAGTYVKQPFTAAIASTASFYVWLKGSGIVTIIVGDDTSASPQNVTLTSSWVRYNVSRTIANTNPYVKILKSTALTVEVFGAFCTIGTNYTYVPSGVKYTDLFSAQKNGTQLSCIVSSFVDSETKYSASALILSLKRTGQVESNVTFTCTLKISEAITPGTN